MTLEPLKSTYTILGLNIPECVDFRHEYNKELGMLLFRVADKVCGQVWVGYSQYHTIKVVAYFIHKNGAIRTDLAPLFSPGFQGSLSWFLSPRLEEGVFKGISIITAVEHEISIHQRIK